MKSINLAFLICLELYGQMELSFEEEHYRRILKPQLSTLLLGRRHSP